MAALGRLADHRPHRGDDRRRRQHRQVRRIGRQPRRDRHEEQPRGGRRDRASAAAARHRRHHRRRLHRHGARVEPRPRAAPTHRVPVARPHEAPGRRGHLARPRADDAQEARPRPHRVVQRDLRRLRRARPHRAPRPGVQAPLRAAGGDAVIRRLRRADVVVAADRERSRRRRVRATELTRSPRTCATRSPRSRRARCTRTPRSTRRSPRLRRTAAPTTAVVEAPVEILDIPVARAPRSPRRTSPKEAEQLLGSVLEALPEPKQPGEGRGRRGSRRASTAGTVTPPPRPRSTPSARSRALRVADRARFGSVGACVALRGWCFGRLSRCLTRSPDACRRRSSSRPVTGVAPSAMSCSRRSSGSRSDRGRIRAPACPAAGRMRAAPRARNPTRGDPTRCRDSAR